SDLRSSDHATNTCRSSLNPSSHQRRDLLQHGGEYFWHYWAIFARNIRINTKLTAPTCNHRPQVQRGATEGHVGAATNGTAAHCRPADGGLRCTLRGAR